MELDFPGVGRYDEDSKSKSRDSHNVSFFSMHQVSMSCFNILYISIIVSICGNMETFIIELSIYVFQNEYFHYSIGSQRQKKSLTKNPLAFSYLPINGAIGRCEVDRRDGGTSRRPGARLPAAGGKLACTLATSDASNGGALKTTKNKLQNHWKKIKHCPEIKECKNEMFKVIQVDIASSLFLLLLFLFFLFKLCLFLFFCPCCSCCSY